MKFKRLLALAVILAGAYASGAMAEDAGEAESKRAGLLASLQEAFQSNWSAIEGLRKAADIVKTDLLACFYEDEFFAGIKQLWAKSCSQVISEAMDAGMPYSLMRAVIVQNTALHGPRLVLLDAFYKEETVLLTREQTLFIEEELIPQLQSCGVKADVEALSCASLIAAAKDEGFSYFQLEAAIESAVRGRSLNEEVNEAPKQTLKP